MKNEISLREKEMTVMQIKEKKRQRERKAGERDRREREGWIDRKTKEE